MKILVCISKTADTTAKIAFTPDQKSFLETGVQFIINPYDEWYALVRAVELKEQYPDTVLHLITVGGADAEPILRKALAIGGDAAFRVDLQPISIEQVALSIAAHVKQEGYDLIFTGKETIDYNGSGVGGYLAGLLDWPFVSLATRFDYNGQTATVEREIEGGREICEASLPLVVSCQKGMAEQRIPNMRGIMAARTKPLQVLAAPPEAQQPVISIDHFALPPKKSGVHLIEPGNEEELVRLLHEEAKVI
ncbi:MAG: electron transfer flavoprotein subunit beta/FixA family protein [Thermoflavifilum aggregans]|nr:electron transfer flavoprotein subunit beta/FixA family protein [Thermoflavifilum aggregans]